MSNMECRLLAEILPSSESDFSSLLAIHFSLIWTPVNSSLIFFVLHIYISKHILSIYCVLGTKLNAEDMESNKTHFLFLKSPIE